MLKYTEMKLFIPRKLFKGEIINNFIFTDYNEHPHPAGLVNNYLECGGIQSMEWPVYPQDLNTIEHGWDVQGHRLASLQHTPGATRRY
ncbi:hypothetical protein AVEN_201561-1 [Araneus ventricosus]|uniref:Tc1-like transposase DDE domain-containing protein n=1 Tax=Araneus ventricosus TaxID=182803 RepID=A0A4Y2I5D7_ARAVE|nr:hypothetical protein AVEN_201561-1 [Araneus ventricosus]